MAKVGSSLRVVRFCPKKITAAFRAVMCNQKTHSWIFPEVRLGLKREKKPTAGYLPPCQRGTAKPAQPSREAEGEEAGASPAGLCLEGSTPSLLRGICPVPTTLAPPWLAGTESYPQKRSESWQPSPSPRNESKSFDTPMVHPFLQRLEGPDKADRKDGGAERAQTTAAVQPPPSSSP